jgi:prepilin-type N-terminal cleavage/methylation domain-containing protein
LTRSWRPPAAARGFTLIEVVAALVIFSVGVLMVIRLSSALGTQMTNAGARSMLVVLANEGLDSLQATPFDSLDAGTTLDTVLVQGRTYARLLAVTAVTPMLSRIDVSLTPLDGAGPTHSMTSYSAATW